MTNEGISAWYKAKETLLSQNATSPVSWSDELALAAQDHCKDSGPKGRVGHKGQDGSTFQDRVNRYGTFSDPVSENIAYGRASGADLMLQLFIDDGVKDRRHRKNMLNSKH